MKPLREILRGRQYEAPPPQIVIGHTTHESVKVWIRGEKTRRFVRVEVTEDDEAEARAGQADRALAEDTDFTDVVQFEGLKPHRCYRVLAQFSRNGAGSKDTDACLVGGCFRTFASPDEQAEFSFLHGSCNLSIVSVNNTLALAAGAGGTRAVRAALDHAPTPTGGFKRLKIFLFRWHGYALVERATKWLFAAALWLTGWLKQPGQPLLRSPFLRLSSLIATWELPFTDGREEPSAGSLIIGSASAATGLLLRRPKLESGSWGKHNDYATGVLELVQVQGVFQSGEALKVMITGGLQEQQAKAIAQLSSEAKKVQRDRQEEPAFMIHAGDQIYFDFPFTGRRPALDEYRLCYREAWSDDKPLRGFLAQCPHYMTLDDHEIVDQYAADINTPKYSPSDYLQNAKQAYREYAHCRHPDTYEDSLYYSFQYGTTQFFVMDTRSERCGHSGWMVSRRQLEHFQNWLAQYRCVLKFVVTSVPFVGELRQEKTTRISDQARTRLVEKIEEREDKWCGERYRNQREEIIDFIAAKDIERLIFLVGDMHCCYHATMDIGYRSSAIHELGAGPIHQLELSRRDQFVKLYQSETERGTRFRIELRQFDSGSTGVMKLRVRGVPSSPTNATSQKTTTQEVDWQVVRTLGSADSVAVTDYRGLTGRIPFWSAGP